MEKKKVSQYNIHKSKAKIQFYVKHCLTVETAFSYSLNKNDFK